jgi:hypothetical protein
MEWTSRNEEPFRLIRIAVEVAFSPQQSSRATSSLLSEEEQDEMEIRIGNFSSGLLEVPLREFSKAAFFIHPTVRAFLREEGLNLLLALQGLEPHDHTQSEILTDPMITEPPTQAEEPDIQLNSFRVTGSPVHEREPTCTSAMPDSPLLGDTANEGYQL